MENIENKELRVKDIMTTNVVVAFKDEPVIDVARRIFEHDFNGLPVVDIDRKVVGVITQYDLVSGETTIHIPTLIKLFQRLPVLREERPLFKEKLKPLLDLKVKDIMNSEALLVDSDETIQGLANIFAAHHKVNPIPVVNKRGELLGVVSRYDLVKFIVGPSQPVQERTLKPLDIQVNDFIEQFEKRFTVTTKIRARHWLMFSVLFSIVGFIIAFAIILRVAIK